MCVLTRLYLLSSFNQLESIYFSISILAQRLVFPHFNNPDQSAFRWSNCIKEKKPKLYIAFSNQFTSSYEIDITRYLTLVYKGIEPVLLIDDALGAEHTQIIRAGPLFHCLTH